MKIEVTVGREELIINVDGYNLNVYEDLSNDVVEDPEKKSVWIASMAYEVERRHFRFLEIERKAYMTHWRYWATRWLRAKDMKDTSDFIDSAVSKIFGGVDVTEKVKNLYVVMARSATTVVPPYETWSAFFADRNVSDYIKNECKEMYKVEFEKSMTYDKMVDMNGRMTNLVKSLQAIAIGYKDKTFHESRVKVM